MNPILPASRADDWSFEVEQLGIVGVGTVDHSVGDVLGGERAVCDAVAAEAEREVAPGMERVRADVGEAVGGLGERARVAVRLVLAADQQATVVGGPAVEVGVVVVLEQQTIGVPGVEGRDRLADEGERAV